MKQAWEKYGVTEVTFLLIYTAGYNSIRYLTKCPYKAGTVEHKIFQKGRRDGKRG